jgi:hypothetical protein
MVVLIEVHLAPGTQTLQLSEEMMRETQAKPMTTEEAQVAGFVGLPPGPEGLAVHYLAVEERDARWILNGLEASPDVSSFRVHHRA